MVETRAVTGIQNTMAQANFELGHKRSGSDVTDNQSAASRTRTYSETLHIQDECKPTRRKNSDVVDCIGDILNKVDDVETAATEDEDAVGVSQRPTTLDMKPMVNLEQNPKQEAWKTAVRQSREEIDATPCTPPEITCNINSDSR